MTEQKPPVNAGEGYDVRVENVGEKGDGIVRVKGFVLFVPDVKKGDEIRIKITKVLAKVGFAKKTGDAQGPVVNPPRERRSKPRREKVSDEDIAAVLMDSEPTITAEDSDDFGADLDDEDY